MVFKNTPTVGPRYWAAMGLASIAGANMGDIVSDEFNLAHLQGLPWLALLFALILLGNRSSRWGGEIWYWLAIVTVRTAATNLADAAIADAGWGYATAAGGLAVVLAVIVLARGALRPGVAQGRALRVDAFYWLAMLVAGTLGTVIADGVAHIFQPPTVGVPVAALLATLAVALALGLSWRGGAAIRYWLAIVAVRDWGTNTGDILGYLLSRPASLLLSLLLLVTLLTLWRRPDETVLVVA